MKKTIIFFMVTMLFLPAMSAMTILKSIDEPVIQVAILLDTSSSMEGLIGQAKAQLWKMVNQLAQARRSGVQPRIEVALYEYGKSSIPVSQGYIRLIVPLTHDLDLISEELFKLETCGGDEYCGQVIRSSLHRLLWSANPQDYKVIFIAGNEPFNQGEIDFRQACKFAKKQGIIVNTIFCGDHQNGIATHWQEGADITDGQYLSINQNRSIDYIAAPQDEALIRLGCELNNTYIAYGANNAEKKERQERLDKSAASLQKSVIVERAITKGSTAYQNSSWDLVDAITSDKTQIKDIKENELPVEMKPMNYQERLAYVKKLIQKRQQLQKQIMELQSERILYLAGKQKETGQGNTLDEVIIKTVKLQLSQKKFDLGK